MSRLLSVIVSVLLLLAMFGAVSGQDTGEASITVTEQVVVNGAITVASAIVPESGWVVVHAVVDGQLGPTVGIAPLQAGANENVQVMIDALGATHEAVAMLHSDTGTAGMYEFDMMPENDPMVMQGDQPVQTSFRLTGVTTFPQMINNDTAVIGSVISAQDGWIAVSADNNGQPGDVLGSAAISAGTSPGVMVPISAEGRTGTLWATLHTDDGSVGTFEYDGQSGVDAPLSLNGVTASGTIVTSESPVVITVLGTELGADPAPTLDVQDQESMGDGMTSTLQVNRVVAPAPGWVEVHADAEGHPGKPLGMTTIPQGESTGVEVPLDAQMIPTAPPTNLPPVVWPMLHVDDHQEGVYEYLMIPGADVPVVVNGAVVTLPVAIVSDGGEEVGSEATEHPESTEAADQASNG